MNRRARLNLILLAVAGGLGVGIYLAGKSKPPGPPLTPVASDALDHILIAHPASPAIELKKGPAGWQLVAPVQAAVDPLEVNALVDLVTRETHDPIASPDLKQLGLDPPAYTITLNETKVAFGGVEPLQYRRYVRIGETVTLIEDPASAALDADYADLVAKDLFASGEEIEKIGLPELALSKAPDGKWQITPADPKAGADAMQKLADGWKSARAMWNESSTPAETKAPRVKVTLKGGAVREFIVVATEPQLKLQRADLGVNYVLSKALADELLKLPAAAAK